MIRVNRFALPIGLMLFALVGCEQAAEVPGTEAAFVLSEALAIEDFELTRYQAGAYGIDDTRGRWSLFFFGYTHCPDVCPSELFMPAEMTRAMEKEAPNDFQPPQVVFVSLDPQRDTPESLQQYAGYYHPSFIGITGRQPAVDRLAQAMGVYYERVYHRDGEVVALDPQEVVPDELKNAYLINHSASIFLLDPAAKMHAIFTPPHDPVRMIRDLAAIQAAWR